jgi:transcriptional regulator with XRE-family HTH domain
VIIMADGERKPETPEVKRRRLRTALRQARLDKGDKGMTQKAAADALVWSVSKIVRIEQGTVPVTPTDVKAMLQLYGADDERINQLVDLAKEAREEKRGWTAYSDLLSFESKELFANEPAAKIIYKYEPSVVPGLFQTLEYARGLLRALGNSEADVDKLLDVRTQRQELLDSPHRPELNFILGETALSRPVGGEEVMREQIEHIRDLAKVEGISVRLLPFAAGPHRSMGEACTVLQFNDPQLPDLLYLEDAERESVSRDEEEDVRKYLEIFVELQTLADKHGSLEEHIERILRERYS